MLDVRITRTRATATQIPGEILVSKIPAEPSAPKPKKRLRRWMAIVLGALIAGYLLLVGVLFFAQSWLIFPGRVNQGTGLAKVLPPTGCELLDLKAADGTKVAALLGPALDHLGQPLPDAKSRPTLLFFYGNGECLAFDLDRFDEFRRLGFNVMIPDYVGYGLSDGKPSEAGCYAAADAAYNHLLTRSDIDPKKIISGGWSLGGAVAIDLASRKPVSGLMVFSTFTSMGDMVGTTYPFVPKVLLVHKFDSLRKIAKVKVPTLIGHGTIDDIVPFRMAAELASEAGGEVTRIDVEGATHNDFFQIGRKAVSAAMRKFLQGEP